MHFFVIGKTPDGHLGFLLEPQVSKDSGKRLLVDDIKKIVSATERLGCKELT